MEKIFLFANTKPWYKVIFRFRASQGKRDVERVPFTRST